MTILALQSIKIARKKLDRSELNIKHDVDKDYKNIPAFLDSLKGR